MMDAAAATANPFDAFPPIDLSGGPGGQAPSGGNPFDAFPPIDLNAKTPSVASPHTGALANSGDDGYGASILKGAATAAIKGVGDIPGIVGNLANAGEMAGDYGLAAIQTAGGYRGSISDQAAKNAAAREAVLSDARSRGMTVPSDVVPTGETFSNPVLAKTGEYVPESPLGRIGMAGVEAAVGGAPFGPAGVAGKLSAAGTNLVGGVAGQATTEATGNPMAGLLVGAAAQHGAHVAGNVATQGASALADATPPITEAQKTQAARRAVGQELNASAVDPMAAQAGLSGANLEIIPGSQATTGPASGDTGLLDYEKGVSQTPEGKAAYTERMAAQNAARQAAVAGVQPTGDVLALPEAVQAGAASADAQSQAAVEAARAKAAGDLAATDQTTQANVAAAQGAHQSALADIQALKPDASPLDVAAHFKSIRDAMETDAAARATREQNEADRARAVAMPTGQSPDQVGAALRTPFDAQANAASDAVSGLYKALPQDLVAPTFGIAGKAKEILGGVLPENRTFGGMPDEDLLNHAASYGDQMPLANVNALRSTILSARSSLRQSDPQAYGRLSALLPPIEASLDHAIENRAALDSIAVRRGAMAPEDAIGPTVDRAWKDELDRQAYNLSAGQESYGQDAGSYAGVSSGRNGAGGAEGRGFGRLGGDTVLPRGSASALGQDNSRPSRRLAVSLPNAPRDQSLNQYLSSRGGLKASPELAKLFGTQNPVVGGGKLIRQNGMNLDRALEAAKDGGYLFDNADVGRGEAQLTHADLLNKIAEDHRTGNVVPYNSANEDWRQALEARAHEKELRSYLKDIGVNAAKLDPRVITSAVGHMMDGDPALEAFGKGSQDFHTKEFGPTTDDAKSSIAAPEPEQPVRPEDWQVVGANPLREANAAYKAKKQTFDEGPIGEAFAKNGRGQPDFSNAELAGKVFHGRPTNGEDMRAYLKAAGPEGVPAASDAAALSFRDAAMKDGVVDPKAAASWIEKHKNALAELPANVRFKFETAGEAQKTVAETMAKTRDSLKAFDASEAGKVAGLSSSGDIVKHVGSILESNTQPEAKLAQLSAKAAGNPAAVDGLKRAAIEHVLDKFVPEGGDAKPDKLASYVAAKRDVLAKVLSPAEIDAIGSKASAASEAEGKVKAAASDRDAALKATQKAGEASVKGAETSRKEMLSKYDKGVLGDLKGVAGSQDGVINVVRRALNADNGETQMAALAKEAAKTPEGTEALKRAVAEVVRRDTQSTSEAGTSGIFQMKRAELQKFMDKRSAALKAAGLSDQQIGVLRAVTEDSLRANRIISATAAKGGSDTNQNRAMAAKLAHAGHQSILSHLVVDAAMAMAGHVAGSLIGPEEGLIGAFAGKSLGDKVIGAMREAGLDRIQKLRVEAVMNPPLALALMKEFPLKPNHGTAAEVGLRLRQMSLAAILAANKH